MSPTALPSAGLLRPDGCVAWVGDRTHLGLPDALTTWFGTTRLTRGSGQLAVS